MNLTLRILDKCVTWLTLVGASFFIVIIVLDIWHVIVHPEDFKNVQFQIEWKKDDHAIYLFRNIAILVFLLIFLYSAFRKMQGQRIWAKVFYLIWTGLLVMSIYNLTFGDVMSEF